MALAAPHDHLAAEVVVAPPSDKDSPYDNKNEDDKGDDGQHMIHHASSLSRPLEMEPVREDAFPDGLA